MLRNVNRTRPFREKGWKLPRFSQYVATGKGIGKPLGKSQRLLGSFWEILKGYRKAARKCPNTCNQPIGEEAEFPSGYWQKRGNFHPFSLKGRISAHIYQKSKEQ
jgi:hypothetical protein